MQIKVKIYPFRRYFYLKYFIAEVKRGGLKTKSKG